jgi:mRNA-degrading endonuclease RelE of RelBE toxin-antitoxin system
MSYNIKLSANFKKEAKWLTKKYPSLKSELAKLFSELEENPKQLAYHLAMIFIKYVWLSLQKTKANQVEQESCLL